MATALEQVQTAIDEGAHARALELSLTVWSHTFSPELAAVAQRCAAKALETYEAPPARRNDEFQLAWLERAKTREPLATAWLASTLGKKLTVEADHFGILDRNYAKKKYAALFERIDALQSHAPSPLVAEAVAALIAEGPYSAWDPRSGQLIYGPLVELLVACKDVRQVALLKQVLETPRAPRAATREALGELLPPALEKLAAVRPTLSSGDAARWLALLPSSARAAEGGQAYLDAIADDLDDDARRLVYADWLTEAGDPRGELITIQVREAKGTASAAEKKRARALLKEHEETWLGDLARIFSSYVFERGFLESASIAQNAAATEEVWARAAKDPRLRTLRYLDKGRGNAAHLGELLVSPQTVNLRHMLLPQLNVLETLCAGPVRRVEELELERLPSVGQLRALLATAALPRLEVLTFHLRNREMEKLVSRWAESGIAKKVRWVHVEHVEDLDVAESRTLRAGLFDTRLVDKLSIRAHSFDVRLQHTARGVEVELEDRYGTYSELMVLAAGAVRAVVRHVDRGLKGSWKEAIAQAVAAGVAVEASVLEAS